MTTTLSLGDRMKMYEDAEVDRRFMPLLPICVRADGRAFHSFTRGMNRPFDAQFMKWMQGTCEFMVRETGACIGYTQSDEINLIYFSNNMRRQIFFDGCKFKMTSVLASMAGIRFYQECLAGDGIAPAVRQMPMFDCRCWQVPVLHEAANYLLWRERDATRNSVQMVAQAHYSAKELHKKSISDMHDMLHAKGVNWNNFSDACKRGMYFRRIKTQRPFTAEELDRLPPKHAARSNPDLVVERTDVVPMQMPPFGQVINQVEVVFDGEEPVVFEADSPRGAY